jgi:hypothetical protein
MAFCDDLQANLADILAAITALECCGEQDITDGDQYTDPIVDGEGDVPQNIIDAGYAEDAEDWVGFDNYKCMISHLAVDHVEKFFTQIAPHISDTGVVLGGVGVLGYLLGAILVLVGLPLAAGFAAALGTASLIWSWIADYGRTAVEDLAVEIAIHHDALACAIFEGDGIADSISDFNDKVDELFNAVDAAGIKAINFAPQLKAMYSGRYDQQNIAQNMADQGYETFGYVCICEEEEPPPSGYHLEYPVFDLFRDYRWCQDAGSSYNEETGVLQVKIEPLGNPIYDMRAVFDVLGYWGYVINVLSYDTPTATMERGHDIYQARYGVDVLAGETYAGLQDLRLDPEDEDWAAWLSQYDFIAHNQGTANAQAIMFGQSSEAPEGYELYTWNIRIRIIVPDP